MMGKRILLLLIWLAGACSYTQAQDTNAQQAKQLFMKAYNMVFKSDGCQLSYDVNLSGIYKTQGSIAYKGKKTQFSEKRISSWNDGITVYKADAKKKEVHIYRADDENQDKYMSKFKFEPDDYAYSCYESGNCYMITAKPKKSKMFGVKEAVVKVKQSNLYPVNLRVKVAFLHANVDISNFRSGNIPDSQFVFPKSKYTSYKVTDHRND